MKQLAMTAETFDEEKLLAVLAEVHRVGGRISITPNGGDLRLFCFPEERQNDDH